MSTESDLTTDYMVFQIRTHKRPTVGITHHFHAHISASLKKSYANCLSYKGSYVVSR